MLQQMRRGLEAEGQLPGREQRGEIGTLLLIDRDVDLVSTILSRATVPGEPHAPCARTVALLTVAIP